MPHLISSVFRASMRLAFSVCAGLLAFATNQSAAEDSGTARLQDWTPIAGTWHTVTGESGYVTSGTTGGEAVTAQGSWTSDFIYRASLRSGAAKVGLIYNYTDARNFSEVLLGLDGNAELRQVSWGEPKTIATGSYPGAGGDAWVEVEVVRAGNTTTVRANGAQVFNRIPQERLSAGKLGLCSEAGMAKFSHLSVSCPPQVEYRTSFEGNSAAEWSGKGSWAAADGTYNHSAGSDRDLTLYTGGNWETNYTYRVSIYTPASDEPAKTAGAVYNYVDAENYYEVTLNPAAKMAEVRKVIKGVSVRLAAALNDLEGGRWTDLTILRSGANTTINVDGRRVFTAIAQGELPTGRIGLVAKGGNARFDDIVVTRGIDPYKRTFPRIGGIYIGGPRDFDQPALQQALARHDLVILGMYTEFNKGGKSPAELLKEIKARNPALVVGNYTCVMESYWQPADQIKEIAAKLFGGRGPAQAAPGSPNDWWVRNSAGVAVGESQQTRMTNVTFFVQPDADGLRYPQWYAGYAMRALHLNQPGFDFVFTDNHYADPAEFEPKPSMPDWNRDGTNDGAGAPVARDFRLGMATYVMKCNQLRPELFVMGNVGGQHDSHPLERPEYQRLLGAALYEGLMGKSWSEERWLGWDATMDGYHNLADNIVYPHLLIAAAGGTADGFPIDEAQRAAFAVPYRFLRYALASALMEDAYFSYSDDRYNIERYKWFDEFDLKLGEAIDRPQRAAFQKGIYRRRFQNGMALVNPRTNPDGIPRRTETVTIEPGYRRFRGQQDPQINNGEAVTTVTLPAGDGLILVRS